MHVFLQKRYILTASSASLNKRQLAFLFYCLSLKTECTLQNLFSAALFHLIAAISNVLFYLFFLFFALGCIHKAASIAHHAPALAERRENEILYSNQIILYLFYFTR